MSDQPPPDIGVESERKPLLTARQVGVAAAFGGAALAVVLAGITIPIPGTPVVTDPREIFTTIGASLTGPIGGIIIGILAGIAEPGIPLASLLAHIIGGIYNGFAYKNVAWRFKDNRLAYLGLWALQVLVYYFVVVVPLFVVGLMLFYPDPEYGGFFAFLGVLEAGAVPEAIITTIVIISHGTYLNLVYRLSVLFLRKLKNFFTLVLFFASEMEPTEYCTDLFLSRIIITQPDSHRNAPAGRSIS